MCGRFAIAHIPGMFARFGVRGTTTDFVPRYNIAPSQEVPIIVRESPNKAVMMRWGFVPFWAKDPKIGNRMINARAETITKSPAFRVSIKSKRCLVPSTGFYEWKKTGGRKAPYYCHLKDDSFFAFAGIYDRWKGAEGLELVTFTILTTVPNQLIGTVHDRMPVILNREDEDLWLREEPLEEPELKRLFKPYPSRPLEIYEVSTDVNSPTNDYRELILPASG